MKDETKQRATLHLLNLINSSDYNTKRMLDVINLNDTIHDNEIRLHGRVVELPLMRKITEYFLSNCIDWHKVTCDMIDTLHDLTVTDND